MTGVSVEYIKKITFSQMSLQEKIEIKGKGRSTPDIIIRQTAVSKNKKYIRSFNNEWYEKIRWLCGCEIRNALFCFPCLLFGGDSAWIDSGFTNISRLKEKSEKHQNSKRHMENTVSLSFLGHVNISEQLSENYRIAKLKHNEQVIKNRDILSRIIDYIKFSSDIEMTLCGRNENDFSENFIAIFDPSLQKHLDSVFKTKSKTIQNELLQNMLVVCREQIVSEIEETSYLAVMADDTSDVSEIIQTVIIFRYEFQGTIYERFWGFFNTESSANDASECVLNEIHKVLQNNSNKLIAQTFDETNLMGSVQHNIQRVFKNARYVHCYTHQLTDIMKRVSASTKSARLFFVNLMGMATFFSKSPQRLATLGKYINTCIPISSNDFNFNVRMVNTIFECKDDLIKCFEELQSVKTTNKTIQASTGFLTLLKDETFLFWLEFFHKVMPHVETLHNEMQLRNVDACGIQRALSEFNNAILEIRNSAFCESFSTFIKIESKQVCDHICEEAIQRFAFTNHLITARLFYKENFQIYRKKLPSFEIKEACNIYSDLVREKLETELQIFYSRREFHNFNGLHALLNLLTEENLSSVFSEMIRLIKILVTIPMITTEPERCFSTMKVIKSFLRNDINEERLTALSMISIERRLISGIKNFNEKVIEKFCQDKNQRTDFLFK